MNAQAATLSPESAEFQKKAENKQRWQDAKEFLLEGTSGKAIGGALVVGGALLTGASFGAAAPIGVSMMAIGAAMGLYAGKAAKNREKYTKELRKPEWQQEVDKFFEGTSGMLVGTGLAAAGAVALATGALPFMAGVVAVGAIAIGAHLAASAPGKAREHKKWEKKLMG